MTYIAITVDRLEDIEVYKNAGAQEFIFALENSHFSSQQSFSLEALLHIKQDLLSKDKMAVLMSRLFSQFQIEQAQQDLEQLLNAGVETILFADPGLLRKAKQLNQVEKMVYSPETLVTSSLDAQVWMDFGIQRAVISPLLTEAEILSISRFVPKLSLPIHGYQMMSVSKRHLLSAYEKYLHQEPSLAGKQSLWIQETHRDGHMPIYEGDFGTVVYTDFVLDSFPYIPQLVEHQLERLEMNSHYLSLEANVKALQGYRSILEGEDPLKVEEEYRKAFVDLPLEHGYYGQKTIR